MEHRVYNYGAWSGPHPVHPGAVELEFEWVSGGGGGMGSQSNMIFGEGNPIPYGNYGKRGEPSCVDTLPPASVTITKEIGGGALVHWANHGRIENEPLFFTGVGLPPEVHNERTYYVMQGGIVGPDAFFISAVDYNVPLIWEVVPLTISTGGAGECTVYDKVVWGGCGGGPVGDQAIIGNFLRIYYDETGPGIHPQSSFTYGTPGQSAWACGASGSNSCLGGGAPMQVGEAKGNDGVNGTGGGGGGGGMFPYWSNQQWGPGGGASGTWACWRVPGPPFKATYRVMAGKGGKGGNAGSGGWPGGDGGHGLVRVREKIVL